MTQESLFSAQALSGAAAVLERAADRWGLNCGPGAICAALALHPDTVRPHLGGFEQRRYMSPSHMWAALRSLGVSFRIDASGAALARAARPGSAAAWPKSNGICRVQWGGPWCRPEVPPAAAYRHTHWIAARRDAFSGQIWIFDVNNLIGPGAEVPTEGPDGWLYVEDWGDIVAPALAANHKRADGRWWLTHVAEVYR